MGDNKTSQKAKDYDAKVEKTHPMYPFFHNETLSLVEVVNPEPSRWLDTGCGTGELVSKALKSFEKTHFVLADPSEAMLAIAKEKFDGASHSQLEYVQAGTEELNFPVESFDVITAILSHHYFDRETREKVTAHCFSLLKEGGVYVTFENITPYTEKGIQIGLERWCQAQIKKGKSVEEAQRHMTRFGKEYYPITLDSHVRLLQDAGFSTVEVLWVSSMQAGFYAIK